MLGADPGHAMTFAGVLLIIAAVLTLTIKTSNKPYGVESAG